MTLKEFVKNEMMDSKVTVAIDLTKTTQENILYLLKEFDCETTDELINILLCYAATTYYTERVKKEINE